MTQEPKLLTECEWLQRIGEWGVGEGSHLVILELHDLGLIAPEPVDPLLVEARQIVKVTLRPERHKRCNCRDKIDAGEWDRGEKVSGALAALRRGMEIAALRAKQERSS